ncbi:hypothetical protein ACFGYA_07690, partial [Pasteurella multocida]
EICSLPQKVIKQHQVPSNNQPSTNGQPRGNQKVIRRVVWVSRRFVLELDINWDYGVLHNQP